MDIEAKLYQWRVGDTLSAIREAATAIRDAAAEVQMYVKTAREADFDFRGGAWHRNKKG